MPPAAVAALASAAGLVPCGGTWGSPSLYCLTLLLTPEVALRRAWADTDSLFSVVHDLEAQVGWAWLCDEGPTACLGWMG